MAAGQGFKTFATGDTLTAADVNGYLMQGVLVFASAAARNSAITSPQQGQVAFLKDTNVTTYYNGTTWTNLDTTGMVNPMTTTGDTIYSSSGSTPARLGIGSTGQVMTVAGGVPSWATPSAGFANPMTTTGDMIYSSPGSTPARLGVGSTGQVITVAGGVPTWSTPTSSSAASASATVATEQTTNSSTYTDLATAGPAVTITTGTKALVIVTSAILMNATDNLGYMSYAVSGSTTIAASDTVAVDSIAQTYQRFSAASRLTSLTAGSNTFTAKYKSATTTGYFKNREIIVIDLGS
jgi:hypothetical protein